MTVEQAMIISIRKILINDSTINQTFLANVYAAHISSITKPVYPAISLSLLSSPGADFDAMGFVTTDIQIDGWFPTQQYDDSAIQSLQTRLRALLHRQSITDKTVPVHGSGFEKKIGPVIVEADAQLIHLPVIYTFMAY